MVLNLPKLKMLARHLHFISLVRSLQIRVINHHFVRFALLVVNTTKGLDIHLADK
jgi:hypothetical protein